MVPALISTEWAIAHTGQFKEIRNMLVPFVRGFTDFENYVKTISDAVGILTSRITNVEQIVSALHAKMVSFAEMEQNVNSLTQNVSSSTVQDRTSATSLLQALPGQQDLGLARLVFETKTKCQEFVTRFKDDGLPQTVDSPFRNNSAAILVRQSKSPEDRETGKKHVLHRPGECWPQNCRLFP